MFICSSSGNYYYFVVSVLICLNCSLFYSKMLVTFLEVDFVFVPWISGIINSFYLPISEEFMIYFSDCFISINNILSVIMCYPSPLVSGFSGNEYNSHCF
jgi:hypothetical protein